MLTLPLPILTFMLSIAACVIIWRIDLGNKLARNLLTGACTLMSLGALLIALRFGYEIETFTLIQRIVPLFIGPLLLLGFAAFIWHAGLIMRWLYFYIGLVISFVVLTQVFTSLHTFFDIAIGTTYLVSIIGLIAMWRMEVSRLINAPLDLVQNLRSWFLWAALGLSVILIFETSIAVSFALSKVDQAVTLVSYGSIFLISSMLVSIAIFLNRQKTENVERSNLRAPDRHDFDLEQKSRALLAETKLYLDTNLTLERLARRLHVPARALSEAINQTQTVNVSQYVNGFRLSHASKLLVETDDSVAKIIEKSGFLSRSNFYREFERVYKQSPIEFRQGASTNLESL